MLKRSMLRFWVWVMVGAVNLSYQAADAGQALCVRVYHPTVPSQKASRDGIDELALATERIMYGTVISIQ